MKNIDEINHEYAFVDSFILQNKRKRSIGLLDKERRAFLKQLYHFRNFDLKYLTRIDNKKQEPESILDLLRSRSAGKNCYLFSAHDALDQKKVNLEEALKVVVGYYGGTIISCLPGVLAYYEGEDRNERYILHKEKNHKPTKGVRMNRIQQ